MFECLKIVSIAQLLKIQWSCMCPGSTTEIYSLSEDFNRAMRQEFCRAGLLPTSDILDCLEASALHTFLLLFASVRSNMYIEMGSNLECIAGCIEQNRATVLVMVKCQGSSSVHLYFCMLGNKDVFHASVCND